MTLRSWSRFILAALQLRLKTQHVWTLAPGLLHLGAMCLRSSSCLKLLLAKQQCLSRNKVPVFLDNPQLLLYYVKTLFVQLYG